MARILLLLALASCLSPAAYAEGSLRERLRERVAERRGDALPMAGGTHERQLAHDGQQRRYLIYRPANLPPEQPLPLVIALHGGGGHAEYMADEQRYGLIGKAEQAGFVVVFPNGYSRLPRGRLATWNAGGCCGDARDRGSDDVGFIRAVVAAVSRETAIDTRRVFALGMSNGGMLAHRLACDAPDVFRAVASVAGTDATTQCAPSPGVSVLHIHARDDTHVLFEGGAGPDAFRDPNKVMNFVSVKDTVARWAHRLACPGSARRVLERPGARCERYDACRDASALQWCITEQGGHSWPGAQTVRRGKAPASAALDANDTIWDFFTSISPG